MLIKLKNQNKNWLMMRTGREKEKRNNLSAISGKTLKQIEKEG